MPTLLPQPYLSRLRQLLAAHAPDAEVWAYGSRVKGSANDTSDLDLVLRDPEDPTRPQKNLPRLTSEIADSTIPILVDVLDWARLPKGFRDEIRKAYVVISPTSHEAELIHGP